MTALMILLIPFGITAMAEALREKDEKYDNLLICETKMLSYCIAFSALWIGEYLSPGWSAIAVIIAIVAGGFMPDMAKAIKCFLKRLDSLTLMTIS